MAARVEYGPWVVPNENRTGIERQVARLPDGWVVRFSTGGIFHVVVSDGDDVERERGQFIYGAFAAVEDFLDEVASRSKPR